MTGQGVPPTGTIAMLFTDIEGSTALATRLGPAWTEILERHHAILCTAIEDERGWVDSTEGDAFFATFSEPAAAARAAAAAQQALWHEHWPENLGELRVRMGLHVGHVERTGTGYVGLEVHRAARIGAAAHGGQLLLSAAAREVIGEAIPVEFIGAHRLKDFPAPMQLYCAVIDGRGASAFPPPRAADARPTNLPAGLPNLVGRDEDLAEIRTALLVERERVVSLTGRGGSGKTSLALVAGAGLLDDHPAGVWWVNLAGITAPDAVLDAVAAAVGAERDVQASAFDAVTGRLRGGGPALVLLDNMEHLVAAGGDVQRLLDALPELRVIATTQAPLRLATERVIQLDALPDEAALALIERVARRRGARLPARPHEREALIDVIHLLDGMPLALELAAARLAVLTPAQLHERLAGSLEILRDPARPERQRSLQATVDWTLSLLDDQPRELFTRLGVFARPVELEEIELVCGQDGLDALEALAGLLDVALVRRVESGDGRIRFGLPEALRQIASRRLDAGPDAARWRRAHAQRQLEVVAVGMYPTVEDLDAALAADAEAVAALRWAREHGEAIAEPLAAHRAFLVLNQGGLREADSLLAPLLDSPPEDPNVRSLVLQAHAVQLTLRGEPDEGLRYAEEAMRIARGARDEWRALELRGLAFEFAGRPELALRDHRQGSAMARSLDAATLAGALVSEVQSLIAAGELDEAEQRLEEARQVGMTVDASALRFVETQEADLAMARGTPQNALDPYARSLEKAQALGDVLQVLFDLRGMANALGALERDEEAIEVLGLADRQAMDAGGASSELAQHLQGDEPVRAALERLGPERAQTARAQGHAVPPGLRVARACQLGRSVLSSPRDSA